MFENSRDANLRKLMTNGMLQKAVDERKSPALCIMLSVQCKLTEIDIDAVANYGIIGIVYEVDGKKHYKVFELEGHEGRKQDSEKLIQEVKRYAGTRNYFEKLVTTDHPKVTIKVDKFIPTQKEVTELGYKHLVNTGNEKGDVYRHQEVVDVVFEKITDELT